MGYWDDFKEMLRKVKEAMTLAYIILTEWRPKLPFRYRFKREEPNLYLGSSKIINSDNERVFAQASLLIKDNKIDTIIAMNNFVINYVEYSRDVENLPWDMRSADQTLARRYGNCADIAVLLVALLRAVNIPARVVAGKYKYIVEYHAWVEVYYWGDWNSIDPTTREIDKEFTSASVQEMMKEDYKVLERNFNENSGDLFTYTWWDRITW